MKTLLGKLIPALKPIFYGACLIGFGLCLTQAGYYYREGKSVEAQGIVIAASFKAIEAMHQSIPWEDRIKRKNELLQAVCKKNKTRLCKEILNEFVAGQVADR